MMMLLGASKTSGNGTDRGRARSEIVMRPPHANRHGRFRPGATPHERTSMSRAGTTGEDSSPDTGRGDHDLRGVHLAQNLLQKEATLPLWTRISLYAWRGN